MLNTSTLHFKVRTPQQTNVGSFKDFPHRTHLLVSERRLKGLEESGGVFIKQELGVQKARHAFERPRRPHQPLQARTA